MTEFLSEKTECNRKSEFLFLHFFINAALKRNKGDEK